MTDSSACLESKEQGEGISSLRGWLIFRHETKLLLLRRLALKKALRAETEQRRLDEMQDFGDHFTGSLTRLVRHPLGVE